jgi:hypothetical protein
MIVRPRRHLIYEADSARMFRVNSPQAKMLDNDALSDGDAEAAGLDVLG